MAKAFGQVLNEYYDKFGKEFPYGYQVTDEEEAKWDAERCLKKGMTAEQLFPAKYGKNGTKQF